MKAVILAGGLGSRIGEETQIIPKPMIEVGGRPLIWHIMKIYEFYGITDFIVCCGYKGYVIKEYFSNYFLHMSDITIDLANNKVEVHQKQAEPWRVTLLDTGEQTTTGYRLKQVRDYISGETFCMTYGDGVGNINIAKSIEFHKKEKLPATVTAVQPPGRFGTIIARKGKVQRFQEKAPGDDGWVNGGFFVLEPSALDYIAHDNMMWEREPMESLAREGCLCAFEHKGFWQCMDTARDKRYLEELWEAGNPPWKIW